MKDPGESSPAQPDLTRRRTLSLLAAGSATSTLPAMALGQSSTLEVEIAYVRVRGFLYDGVYHFLGVLYGALAGGADYRFKTPSWLYRFDWQTTPFGCLDYYFQETL